MTGHILDGIVDTGNARLQDRNIDADLSESQGDPVANPILETAPKITLGITEGCPLRCRHCYADCSTRPKPGELTSDIWLRLISELADGGVIHAYIEGGEPLIKPGFLDILRAMTPRMMTLMRTHGWGLSRDMAHELLDAGLGRALVDFMGDDEDSHERATLTPGSFRSACEAVTNLRNAGIPTDVLVILTRQTAPKLPAIARLAHELGAERIGLLNSTHWGGRDPCGTILRSVCHSRWRPSRR